MVMDFLLFIIPQQKHGMLAKDRGSKFCAPPTCQFRSWSSVQISAFAVSVCPVSAKHLVQGFLCIIDFVDCDSLYTHSRLTACITQVVNEHTVHTYIHTYIIQY